MKEKNGAGEKELLVVGKGLALGLSKEGERGKDSRCSQSERYRIVPNSSPPNYRLPLFFLDYDKRKNKNFRQIKDKIHLQSEKCFEFFS